MGDLIQLFGTDAEISIKMDIAIQDPCFKRLEELHDIVDAIFKVQHNWNAVDNAFDDFTNLMYQIMEESISISARKRSMEDSHPNLKPYYILLSYIRKFKPEVYASAV